MASLVKKGRYSRYDEKLDLIETDVTGVAAETREVIDAIFDELEYLARARPQRYVLACWKNTTITNPDVASYYGERSTRLLSLVKGIVRYASDDPVTRSIVRLEAVKHAAEGMRSNLYETRADALLAIDAMRAKRR